MKCVYVEWLDSVTTYGWLKPDDSGASKITSVGYLIRDYKSFITITTSLGPQDRVLDQLTIPRAAITKIREIKIK